VDFSSFCFYKSRIFSTLCASQCDGSSMSNNYVRPFLKWAGGKFRLLPHILPRLPKGKRLIEPFAGSGVVFLNTDYDTYQLNDTNPDLINLYKILKKEKSDFIAYTEQYFKAKYNNAKQYYSLRDEFNNTEDLCKRSALFIYLNRHCYNGLCRYNSQGIFNVPFGDYVKPYFPEKEMLYFAKKAKRAVFTCHDFSKSMQKSKSGDVIYCDPPYVPWSDTAYFTNYYHKHFPLEQQEALTKIAVQLSQKNITVLISNHHTDYTEQLYNNAEIFSFDVQRNIGCVSAKRGKVKELIAKF